MGSLLYYPHMARKNDGKIYIELGNKLRKAREDVRLTQAEVAKTAGINVSYYAEIERGEVNPTYVKLQAIMRALNIKSLDIS